MERQHLLNYEIKSSRILLLDQDGNKMGEFSRNEALNKAMNQDLDLMQVGQTKDLAICKILNYQAWNYHETKKKHKQEIKNRSQEIKTMMFRPGIGDHDYQLKIKKINEFLTDAHQVKIVIQLKSREGSMISVLDAFVDRIVTDLKEKSTLESKINRSFKEINFILKPEKKNISVPKVKVS